VGLLLGTQSPTPPKAEAKSPKAKARDRKRRSETEGKGPRPKAKARDRKRRSETEGEGPRRRQSFGTKGEGTRPKAKALQGGASSRSLRAFVQALARLCSDVVDEPESVSVKRLICPRIFSEYIRYEGQISLCTLRLFTSL